MPTIRLLPGRRPAWACTASIDVFRRDGSRAITRDVIARWASQPEPLLPVIAQGQVGNVLDPARVMQARRMDVHEHSDEPIPVAVKFEGDPDCYIFTNESYQFPRWQNPAWRMPPGRYRLRVTVYYERGRAEREFELNNAGPRRDDVPTQERRDLARKIVADLRQGRLTPAPYPDTMQNDRINALKIHFRRLKRQLSRSEYFEQVAIYEKALNDLLSLPPCRRDRSFPLDYTEVKEIIQRPDLLTPRTGGRPPQRSVQERNARIAELVKAKNSHLNICLTLDKEKYSIPATWRKDGINTWRQAYLRNRNSVHSLISKAATKKLTS
jgi:hypothetical protein